MVSMLPACCQHVASILPACCQHVVSMLSACCQTCCQPVASMLSACCHDVVSMWRVLQINQLCAAARTENFSALLQLRKKKEFSPNSEALVQNLGLSCSFEVLDISGGKSIFVALNSRALSFGTKQIPAQGNIWWKIGFNIWNHFWEIENWKFFLYQVPSTRHKNDFQILFYT